MYSYLNTHNINMKSRYTGYKANQFLNDDYFIDSELYPTSEKKAFWADVEKKDNDLKQEIEIARAFIKSLKHDSDYPLISPGILNTLWKNIEKKNLLYEKKKHYRLFFRITAVAATIGLVFLFSWQLLFLKEQETDYLAIIESTSVDMTSLEEVELILAENKKILIPEKESLVEYSLEGNINVNSRQIANEVQDESDTQQINQLIVPYGKRSTVIFSDGSKAWINSGSKVIYPVTFNKSKREIFVEGEIYLDVAEDQQRPFIVKTEEFDVKVLGTIFNISAYKNDPHRQVVLVNGKVEVHKENNSPYLLAPNQLFDYNPESKKITIKTVDVNNYITWKDGYYQLHQQPLDFVLRKLTRDYGYILKWDEEVGKLSCSGKLDLNDELDIILDNLKEAAPIRVIKKESEIKISINP